MDGGVGDAGVDAATGVVAVVVAHEVFESIEDEGGGLDERRSDGTEEIIGFSQMLNLGVAVHQDVIGHGSGSIVARSGGFLPPLKSRKGVSS